MNRLPAQKNNRYGWIDALRIIGMIAVIFIHVFAKATRPVTTTSGRILTSLRCLPMFAVPLFVMISGSFILDPEREFSTKDLFRRKTFRLLIVWIFWTVVYAGVYYFVGEVKGNVKALVANLIAGPGHLWYLTLLIGLYIITPLLRRITSSEKHTKYFLVVSFVITFVVPTVLAGCRIVDHFVGDRLNTSVETFASGILNDFHITYTASYTFYYVLGFYLRKKELSRKTAMLLMLVGILGTVCTFAVEFVGCQYTDGFADDLFGWKIGIAMMTVGIFVFGKCVIGKHMKREGTQKCISTIAKLSFGVYLLQSMVIVLVQNFLFDPNKYNPFWSIPVTVAIVLTICLVITAVLKKIPGVNKYIV